MENFLDKVKEEEEEEEVGGKSENFLCC